MMIYAPHVREEYPQGSLGPPWMQENGKTQMPAAPQVKAVLQKMK